MKFGNKTVTVDKCFVSNQQKIVAFFVTSDNKAKFVIFWVPYNPTDVYELKYQITFTYNNNLNLLDAPYTVFVYQMEDAEIKKSPAIDKVINVSYKMFPFILLCLTMFSPVTTHSESEIRTEIFLEYTDSHIQFLECFKNRNKYFPEETPLLKFLESPDKPSI